MLSEKDVRRKYHDELSKAVIHCINYNNARDRHQYRYYVTTLTRAKVLSQVLEIPLPVFEEDYKKAHEKRCKNIDDKVQP